VEEGVGEVNEGVEEDMDDLKWIIGMNVFKWCLVLAKDDWCMQCVESSNSAKHFNLKSIKTFYCKLWISSVLSHFSIMNWVYIYFFPNKIWTRYYLKWPNTINFENWNYDHLN
jgi:hypothetical protein